MDAPRAQMMRRDVTSARTVGVSDLSAGFMFPLNPISTVCSKNLFGGRPTSFRSTANVFVSSTEGFLSEVQLVRWNTGKQTGVRASGQQRQFLQLAWNQKVKSGRRASPPEPFRSFTHRTERRISIGCFSSLRCCRCSFFFVL